MGVSKQLVTGLASQTTAQAPEGATGAVKEAATALTSTAKSLTSKLFGGGEN
jgi:hypothetical protein